MTKTHIRNLSLDELRAFVADAGEPTYRFRQLAVWLYARCAESFDEMTDLSKGFRETLAERFTLQSAQRADVQTSQRDGTRKYLFELPDGGRFESVTMAYETRTTLCVSSQVGCPLDCTFCETARGGFMRSLTAGEILDQICTLKRDAGIADKKVNVVFMGMGEPMLNFEEVVRAIRTMNDEYGFDMGSKRINVSTSSFPSRIRDLAAAGVKCSLALSLNAPDDEKRKRLMPKASRFSIAELLDAAQHFADNGTRRVTLEYVMLKGFNTEDADADALGKLVERSRFKLNLIPYNPGRDSEYQKITEDDIQRFVRKLLPVAPTVTVRRSRGLDIDAACGQLWTKNLRTKRA